MPQERITLYDYMVKAAQYKWKIIFHFFLICIVAVFISLGVPKTYIASTTILPSTEETGLMGISSLLSDLPSIGGFGGISTLSGEGATLMSILKSRTMFDSVINKFNLMEIYKTPTMVETRKALWKMVSMAPTDEGMIVVSCRAKTEPFSFGAKDNEAKRLSHDMANFFISQLDQMNKKLRTEKAKSNREFIEKRLQENKAELVKAEEAFNRFQKEYGVIAIEEQTAAAIDFIAALKGKITLKEIEIEQLRYNVSPDHADLLNAKNELAALEKKYNALIQHRDDGKTDIFITAEDIPDAALNYARLFREIMIQEKIQEFIVPLYEQAKIQEAKDTPSLQIIDTAVIPDKKSSPKRAYIVLFAGFVSLLFSFLSIYISVNLEYIKNTDTAKYNKITNLLRELARIRK